MSIQQPYRIFHGGRVDRDRVLRFVFDGRDYEGFAGDTLASALLANGVSLVGRSFKYHRPRGILSDGSEEPNALIQLERNEFTQPNVRATQIELYEGLCASSQNRWPNLAFDAGEINNVLAAFLPAGFYYKTFMWPASYWHRYEYFIRKAAGLGRAPQAPDPDRYEKRHDCCDVLVVGGGPAGLAGALAVARTGARVILVDERCDLGGSLLGGNERVAGVSALDWVDEVAAELAALTEVTILRRTTVAAYFDHNYLTALERVSDHLPPGTEGPHCRQRLWKIRARHVLLATGAHERPIVFANNDRPGVMLAGAAQSYINRYAVRCGNKAVIFTNNDSAYRVAADLSDGGVHVTLVEWRQTIRADLAESMATRAIDVLLGHAVRDVKGRLRVKGVVVEPRASGDSTSRAKATMIPCDHVCMSGGWNPAVHLFSQSGGKLAFDENAACFVPAKSVQAQTSAGACRGVFGLDEAIRDGEYAGNRAAFAAGVSGGAVANTDAVQISSAIVMNEADAWPIAAPSGSRSGPQFIDFQNDVTAKDVMLAAREGYVSVEHLKRYTTTGMGTDQGKTSNVNALAMLGRATGRTIPNVGTTTFRPPYTPVTFGALAGRNVRDLSDPVRTTPMHGWHQRHGALFEDVGQWKRAWYYPKGKETMREAVNRECLAARNGVALLDASTLGKIDIKGPDAAEFLERIYTNNWRGLDVGKCRYGLMCKEDGMVFDDGVCMRVDDDQYLMTTTTGNAAAVLAWLEEWLQTEWPTLKVFCNSVTEQWAVVAVVGPLARDLLHNVTEGLDLDDESFPFMSVRPAHVAGVPARIARVSFTGELSYEVSVPADFGAHVWSALMHAGEKYAVTPYGTESMHVLRAEKGFIIAGQETDGTVSPLDLGLERMVSARKDFIGKRSLARADARRADRKQLVGLLVEDGKHVLPEGAQIVAELESSPPMEMIGHVTSSYFSANLGRSIALALIKGGRSRHDEIVYLPLDTRAVAARVTPPEFWDGEGARGRG